MWSGLLARAVELIAPSNTADPVDELRLACANALTAIEQEDVTATRGAFDRVIDYLQGEKHLEGDAPCMIHFALEFLPKLVATCQSIPAALVEPMCDFFVGFISSCSSLLPIATVHRSVAAFVDCLPGLFGKDPDSTISFARRLFNTTKRVPVVGEMLGAGLGNLLADTCYVPGKRGQAGRRLAADLDQARLRRRTCDFLITVVGCAPSIRFPGSCARLLAFADSILDRGDFPEMAEVLEVVAAMEAGDRCLALSFLMSWFRASCVAEPAVEAAQLNADELIVAGLASGSERRALCSVALFKAVLWRAKGATTLFPDESSNPRTDVMAEVPADWLIEADGPHALGVYIASGAARVAALGEVRPRGGNARVWPALLALLRGSARTLKMVTEALALAIALAPDLSDDVLGEAFRTAVAELKGVGPDYGLAEGSGARAAILAEFAKEVHGLFVARSRLQS